MPSAGPKATGPQLKRRIFPLNIRKYLFTVRGLSTAAQVAQGGGGVALLGDTLKMSGDSPGPLAAGGQA